MTKLRLQISVILFLISAARIAAQNSYVLQVRGVDKEAAAIIAATGLQTSFPNRMAATDYMARFPSLLQAQGYVTASVDSLRFETTSAQVVIFLGDQYKWAELNANSIDPALLDAIGWREKVFAGKPMDFSQVQQWENRFLDYLENTGHPFAQVFLDSINLRDGNVFALLKVNKGPLYHIDSIRVNGNVRLSNTYLQRYLELPNGTLYSREKLQRVNKKIRELTYVEEIQPSSLSMTGTGAVLNLYLKQKRSSQVNVIIGFLPNNDQLSTKKLLVTGEANILLRNALGSGETIGLNWQQIQVKSPRLNAFFTYPYLFHSPLGLDFNFDIFRKDSSYVNINLQLGAQYVLNTNQSGKLFIQRFQTYLSAGGIDTQRILLSRRLPDIGDVSSFNVGVDYDFNNTDYRLNPRKGYEARIITSIGSKKIKRNNDIIDLKDPADPTFDFSTLYDTVKLKTYLLRARLTLVKYLPLGKRSTLKTAANAGLFQSGNVFRNELFQLGGYKLLRGFDEESQYLSHFAIGTLEYHYLVGLNSYFYVLADGGWGRDNSHHSKLDYTYFGTGLGLAFETKAGIFNLAWAVGKRNDTEFNLRQSKIHIGFASYF